MTAKELAERLNGREYGSVITRAEQEKAKAAGLVVAYGQSDDQLEFEGAIYDEIGAYEGTTVYIKNGALLTPHYACEDYNECPAWVDYIADAKTLTAVWHDAGNPAWIIKTDIPHENFFIYDDDELFSVGIVFRVEDTAS